MPKVCLSRSEWFDLLIVLGVAAMGVAALVAPKPFLAVMPSCLITRLTGYHCWGCGITRAIVSAVKGDLVSAWHYNPLFVIVLPMLCWEYLRVFRRVMAFLRPLRHGLPLFSSPSAR